MTDIIQNPSEANNILQNPSEENNNISEDVLKITVITLEDSKDRQEKFKKELDKLQMPYNVSYGVKGHLLEMIPYIEDKIYQVFDPESKMLYFYDRRQRFVNDIMRKTELGCLLSHIQLYKRLINDTECNAYLVLEDDVMLMKSPETISNYIHNLPPFTSFDVAMLSISDYYPFQKDTPVNDYYYKPKKRFFNRTTSYIVTKSGANKLLLANYPTIGLPSDDLISNLSILDPGFKLIVSNEPIFIHESYEQENEQRKNKV